MTAEAVLVNLWPLLEQELKTQPGSTERYKRTSGKLLPSISNSNSKLFTAFFTMKVWHSLQVFDDYGQLTYLSSSRCSVVSLLSLLLVLPLVLR